jgi:hypothetical protein
MLGNIGGEFGLAPAGHEVGDPAMHLCPLTRQQSVCDDITQQRVAQEVSAGGVGPSQQPACG